MIIRGSGTFARETKRFFRYDVSIPQHMPDGSVERVTGVMYIPKPLMPDGPVSDLPVAVGARALHLAAPDPTRDPLPEEFR